MGWLLMGLVLVLGLAVLGAVALRLVGRLRRGRSAVESLRATLDEGTARLRAGQEQIQRWRAKRRGTDSSAPDA